ncbi:MAG: hypothetical protein NC548_60325 [Lachnospiraceae bacterium]|nr:hypothetical protein [Lachnospiraceae bacterium]
MKTNLCQVLDVEPWQQFAWEGYILRVSPNGENVQKKIVCAPYWLGLEGNKVCELINNTDKMMRMQEHNEQPRFSYYET